MSWTRAQLEISVEDLDLYRREGAPHLVVDVREGWERQICALSESLHVPMGSLAEALTELPRDRPLTLLCHHGVRSLNAAVWLRGHGFEQACSVKGGIDAFAARIEPTMARY